MVRVFKVDRKHPTSWFEGRMAAHKAMVAQTVRNMRRAVGTEWHLAEDLVSDVRAPDPIVPSEYETIDDFVDHEMDHIDRYFHYPRQEGQERYVELVSEAADFMDSVAGIAMRYGVTTHSGAGFGGDKGKHLIADRARERDVPTTVLTITDFDKSGEDIHTAASEDALAWYEDDGGNPKLPEGEGLEFHRIALTEEQATAYGLLDANGKAEAEGIPEEDLEQILTDAMEEYLPDDDAREEVDRRSRSTATKREILTKLAERIQDELDELPEDDD